VRVDLTVNPAPQFAPAVLDGASYRLGQLRVFKDDLRPAVVQ
jgi:hypothetical protein